MATVCGSMLASLLLSGAAHAAWTRIGTGFKSSYLPGLVTRHESGVDKVDVYVVNSNGSVAEGDFSTQTNTLNNWTNLGGVVLSAASAVGWSTHREVFVLGTDFNLYHNWSDNYGSWSGWWSLGRPPSGGLCSAPSAVSWAPGRVDVFLMGCDSMLWHMWTNSGGGGNPWAAWDGLGGPIASQPSAVSRTSGVLDVLVNNPAGHVMDRAWNNGWNWFDTGMVGMLPPSASVSKTFVDAYTHNRSANNFLGAEFFPPTNWFPPGTSAAINNVNAAPHAVSDGDFCEIYYLDAGGFVTRQGATLGAGWFTAANHLNTDIFAGEPSPTFANFSFYVFAIKSDGSLWFAQDTLS